jgi:drug/metabolite transporter (DMT)-like permease
VYASWLWVAFTLTASAAQTARNVMQRELTGALGALGAAQVRFLFGLPFAVLFFVGLRFATGVAAPSIAPAALGFIVMGALALTDAARVRTLALIEVLFAQVAALRLFRERPSGREWFGMALIVAAAAILIGG